MSIKIFISYRRQDSAGVTGRLYDNLKSQFRQGFIKMDVTSFPVASDFTESMRQAINDSEIILIIIGKFWINSLNESGEKRLFVTNDFVRQEIEHAIDIGKILIPVYVNDAIPPKSEELPNSIRKLAHLNGVTLRNEVWENDVNNFCLKLKELNRIKRPAKKQPIGKLLLFLPVIVFIFYILKEYGNEPIIIPPGEANNSTLEPPTNTVTFQENNKYEWKKMADGNIWTTKNINLDLPDSWCYDNNERNCIIYGRLYTWEAAKKACDSLEIGSSLPTFEDWKALAKAYGGYIRVRDGGASKEDVGPSPKNGFKALVKKEDVDFKAKFGGLRTPSEDVRDLMKVGHYWTSTVSGQKEAWSMYFYGDGGEIHTSKHRQDWALSCRCIKKDDSK